MLFIYKFKLLYLLYNHLILLILSITKSNIISKKLKLNNNTVLSVRFFSNISFTKNIINAANIGIASGIIIL